MLLTPGPTKKGMAEENPSAEHRGGPDDAGADATRCAACGAVIDSTEWHPAATQFDDDGEFHLLAFCSSECRSAWQAE